MTGNSLAICMVAIAAALLMRVPAQAAEKVGVLTCNIDGGENYFIALSKNVQCDYMPNSGPPEHYVGTISDLGAGLGKTGDGAMSWDVIAPTPEWMRGVLEGAYGRLPSPTPPLTAGPLLGGFEHAIALHPISVTGDRRFDKFASGVGGLTLRPSME